MDPSKIRVRYSPRWIAVGIAIQAGVVTMAWAGDMFLFRDGSPSTFYFGLFLILSVIVVDVLLFFGVIPYGSITPHRVSFKDMGVRGPGLRPPPSRAVLYPGDAVVMTDKDLFVWRYHSQTYERLEVVFSLVHRDDLERMRSWVSRTWQQPTNLQHAKAVVERTSMRDRLFGRKDVTY
ncbi:hypothetical protein [Glycomyces tenuis]|uniref:hypothetical protein n=1 Tax=Glycomyces tenuis TaxID=58116 RepID=UPI00040B88D4|nr:hypothetical protein [Glycomyces tenuis]